MPPPGGGRRPAENLTTPLPAPPGGRGGARGPAVVLVPSVGRPPSSQLWESATQPPALGIPRETAGQFSVSNTYNISHRPALASKRADQSWAARLDMIWVGGRAGEGTRGRGREGGAPGAGQQARRPRRGGPARWGKRRPGRAASSIASTAHIFSGGGGVTTSAAHVAVVVVAVVVLVVPHQRPAARRAPPSSPAAHRAPRAPSGC